jgi:hypothetical protein
MNERISDGQKRLEKIEKLKRKVLTDIEKELNLIKEELKTVSFTEADFKFLVQRSWALYGLQEYMSEKDVFQTMVARYPEQDIIIYVVSDECLEIWLQEDYNFVFNFLCQAERCHFDISPMLNDDYFGHCFTSVFEIALYQEKKKGNE